MKLPTIASLAAALAKGETTSRELVERALARIADPAGEGARTFTRVYAEKARADADTCDRKRKDGIVPSALTGIPISVKDLFDVAGDVTTAGSTILRGAPAATVDAVAVARLRVAGAVVIGRTNMTEFAYSGIGINPHYGTPANPWDRAARRIPGGSSSGAAVSVADGMAVVGLGTDTGGSVRNPAALCGVAGFKPTQRRVPLAGCFPLSSSLDSIGPLAPSVACCAAAYQALTGEPVRALEPASLAGVRLGVPKNIVLDDLDPDVARAFDAALARLSSKGARPVDMRLPELDDIAVANRRGGILGPEAYALHRKWLAERGADYDPRVRRRLEAAKDVVAADYVELLRLRSRLVAGFKRERHGVDALLLPTVPKIAPAIEPLERDMERFFAVNPLMLRNTSPFNFLDTCAASLPIQRPGEAPVGLTVAGFPGEDERVLAIALAVEAALGS